MSQYTPADNQAVGTDGRIEGPIPGLDCYGNVDHQYFRCRRCGAEAVRKRDLRGCCRE